ncbi:protein ROH1-like [Zingiber officinale]|uniref:protein ROH1-like n=1 Tax=Zingiber officinale TaxID=94328 RepID=UPI001C4C3790|nr:protein ROH1-like [Zingiber officinale]
MEQRQEQDFDRFHSHVDDRLLALLPTADSSHGLFSLTFLRRLLDAFLSCDDEFRCLLLARGFGGLLSRPGADRAVADLLDRTVKSLDVCRAASLALDSIRHFHRLADTAASAAIPGQGGRACRAIAKLLASFLNSAAARSEGSSGSSGRSSRSGHLRTLGRRSYFSGRNTPPVPANLIVPRGSPAGGEEIAFAVYAMSSVLAFTMWALAAALVCQDGGGTLPSSPVSPRQHLPWAGTMVLLQDRMSEEWRSRKGGVVQLAEMQALQRCAKGLMEAVREGGRPRVEDLAERAMKLAEACRRLEKALAPLERQVREVFHRVVGSRAEVLRCMEQNKRAAAPPIPP